MVYYRSKFKSGQPHFNDFVGLRSWGIEFVLKSNSYQNKPHLRV